MDVLVSAELDGQADAAELRSLLDWLNREDPKPWRVEFAPPRRIPGAMGAWAETLQVALGAGGACAVLAHSVAVWVRTRHGEVHARLRRDNGDELVLDMKNVKDPRRVIESWCRGAGSDDA